MTYFSIDTENSGPNPVKHFMMSLGIAAYDDYGDYIGGFYRKIKPIPLLDNPTVLAGYDPEVLKWWESQPDAWAEALSDQRDAEEVMLECERWTRDVSNNGQKVPVAYPSGYDYSLLYYYMYRFTGRNFLGNNVLDIRTYVAGMTGKPFKRCSKREFPKRWFVGGPKHDHTALVDAQGQGVLCMNILRENNALKHRINPPRGETGTAPHRGPDWKLK